MRWCCTVLLLVACLMLWSCDSEDDHAHVAAPPETPAVQMSSNIVDIPPLVRQNLGITFAPVQRRDIANTLRMPGAFELQPLARKEYRLMLPARVEYLVGQFDQVEPGTPLYRFQSPQWPELEHEIVEAEQATEAAEARIKVAEAALQEVRAQQEAMQARLKELAAAGFRRADLEAEAAKLAVSIPRLEAELQASRTALTSARRSYEHALDRAASAVGMTPQALAVPVEHEGRSVPRYEIIDEVEVKATAAGIVETLGVASGSYAEANTLLLTTVDPSRVRFRAVGLQSDLARFAPGQPARIMPPRSLAQGAAADADPVEAQLTLGLDADPRQRTVTLFAKPGELRPWTRPGVSAFLEVVTEASGGEVLAIPKAAVVQDGLTHVFFRRDPANPNKAIRVEADLGISDGQWVEVRSGVGPDDQVVLEGVYELKLATAQNGGPAKGGHFHADGTFHDE